MRILAIVSLTLLVVILADFSQAAVIAPQDCSLASEGMYKANWVHHRILRGEEVIFGADNLESIFTQLDHLRSAGLCR